MITIPACDVRVGDVLLTEEGEPAFVWTTGKPKTVMRVENVTRIVFDDYRHAEYSYDHELDVER